MEILQDVLAAVFTLGDTLGEGLVALTLGFAAKATGIGFLVGALFMLIYGSIVPVSFQVEGLTVVSRRAKGDWRSMCYAVMLAGLVGALLGFIGVFTAIANFIGGGIQSGMMTGAGLILAIVAIDILRGNWKIGLTSAVVAYILFIFIPSPDWGLIIALVGSVLAGVIAGRILKVYEPVVSNPEIEKVRLVPRSWRDLKLFGNTNVVRAALAILALRTGTSIAYSGVDAGLAGATFNADHVNIASGLGGFFSALFGGANVEPIISATAAAPHPMWSGILMMVLTAAILLFGLLPRWGRYVPAQAICGFLLVLGPMIVIPSNIEGILADPVPSAVAAGVTAATIDPFLGMVVGIIVRALMGIFGG
ncbi:MAG: NCS2 family permease [Chloroflexi bacterium]|nr:NCS2 family permease [Chloroflexota bacterium]